MIYLIISLLKLHCSFVEIIQFLGPAAVICFFFFVLPISVTGALEIKDLANLRYGFSSLLLIFMHLVRFRFDDGFSSPSHTFLKFGF